MRCGRRSLGRILDEVLVGVKGWDRRYRTDCVNDLMDHDFAELKLLVISAVANVLRNHRNAIVVVAEALTSTVQRLSVFFVVIVECANACALADAAVSEGASLVVLVAKVERLQEKQDGHTDQRHKQ